MIQLKEISTLPPSSADKDVCEDATREMVRELNDLQNLLFAESKHSVLIVLQGMDASGKDGVIREVFSGVNPMGCRVKGFKKPTEEEMRHEFLWRIHQHVPEKGMIQIFNRSHYEDVVIQKVHRWVSDEVIERRYQHINAFEQLLQENQTHILKFYLHISQEEQHERLAERLSRPEKMWKYNANDMKESERWPAYMEAYQAAFNRCSPEIPWTIVPSDKNWYKEYVVAKKLVDLLKSLQMQYPQLKEA